MKNILLATCLFLIYTTVFTQKNIPESDKKLISELKAAHLNQEKILDNFSQEKTWPYRDTILLGRNYSSVEMTVYGKYFSYNADFLFYEDAIIAYIIKPRLNGVKKSLTRKYQKLLSPIFKFNDSIPLLPTYYNYDEWIKPLDEYNGSLKIAEQSDFFKFYFSIESGLILGNDNGWGKPHFNQKVFYKYNVAIKSRSMQTTNV